MTVQFVHAMENHSHDVCELDYIKHFHNNDLECEFNHFLFDTSTTTNCDEAGNQVLRSFVLKPKFYSVNHFRIALLTSKTRGPPVDII
ncbi:hypothetical protein [Urechidicola vernalis]|uniref:Uncharacterized protein n=1 Tax=Urechidicola vernalis TaxID=3075600 RepID=A0ABU2Y236_9FLAO|nr:hypothetical protein [Urechidicola sp. P050]MDT0551699.1 hypothetical protein [Urechidicola sp. P050]